MEPRQYNYEKIYNRFVKRIFDFTAAVLLTFLLLPVFIVISAAILMNSGLPILYKAERGGYLGKSFSIYKFRTMIKNADLIGGGTTALNDSRITKVGHFLRKTKLDEIPQLLNIIKGEMSFVGPRPELMKYVSNYDEEEKRILKVKPGITDYSSLEFINLDVMVGEINADEVYEREVLPRKNKLRMKYADEVSFRTDCKLLILTVWRVLRKALNYILHKQQ